MIPDNEEHQEAHLVESCVLNACIETGVDKRFVALSLALKQTDAAVESYSWHPILCVPVPLLQSEPVKCKRLAEAFARNFKQAFGIE